MVRVQRTPPVATVTLWRPDALNAITREMLVELDGALEGSRRRTTRFGSWS